MKASKIDYCNLNTSKVVDGINKTVSAVSETFGPKGHCVAIESNFGVPDITRDGATVAKAIVLEDPIENMGAELVKRAAQNTEDNAGDGTTSTSILIKELIDVAKKKITSNNNLNEIKSGMIKAQEEIVEYIKKNAIPVAGDLEKIRKVATISANNDPQIGDLIVDCMGKVGFDGVITADLSKTLDTKIEVISGFKIDRGWTSPNFITSPRDSKCILDNPAILVIGEKLSNIPQIQPFMVNFAQNCAGRELLVICDDIDDQVLTFFLYNHLSGALKSCVIKGVDFGDNRKNVMQDIATYTGATYICSEFGLDIKTCGLEVLGEAKKASISKESCILYEGCGNEDDIKARLEILKDRLNDPDCPKYDKDKFEHRIASLSGGIGVIKAGGASEAEQTNKKATIEDAILAAKSAIEEGVMPGCGSIFLSLSRTFSNNKKYTEDENIGRQIVYESIPILTETVIKNAGYDSTSIISQIENNNSSNYGYNAKTNEFGDLIQMGILDSAKVLRVSLENAVSTASMAILTSCTITNLPEKED